jgi:hypothetical protein
MVEIREETQAEDEQRQQLGSQQSQQDEQNTGMSFAGNNSQRKTPMDDGNTQMGEDPLAEVVAHFNKAVATRMDTAEVFTYSL